MFERFTGRAREVVRSADEEAVRAGAAQVGSEHLLAAIMGLGAGAGYGALAADGLTQAVVRAEAARRSGGGLGAADAEALRTIGIDLDAVVARVEASFGPGALDAPRPRGRGFNRMSRPGRKAIELSLREALRRGDKHIGTEHLVLGLIREDGAAVQIMRDAGVDPAGVRERIERGDDGSAGLPALAG